MRENPKGDSLGSLNVFLRTENSKKLRVPFYGNFRKKSWGGEKTQRVQKALLFLVSFTFGHPWIRCENQIKIVHPGIRTDAYAGALALPPKNRNAYRNLSVRWS